MTTTLGWPADQPPTRIAGLQDGHPEKISRKAAQRRFMFAARCRSSDQSPAPNRIRMIIAASSIGARVRLTSSQRARPETAIAPSMSAASATAVSRVSRPIASSRPPEISITPTAYTNVPGAGTG
jgi:hypothetical protein